MTGAAQVSTTQLSSRVAPHVLRDADPHRVDMAGGDSTPTKAVARSAATTIAPRTLGVRSDLVRDVLESHDPTTTARAAMSSSYCRTRVVLHRYPRGGKD